MPLSEAKSLLQRNANRPGTRRLDSSEHVPGKLNTLPHDPGKDLAGLENLADSLEPFSPIIGLQQVDQPDCLLLDVTGLEHLFGGEDQLARQILQHCQARDYVARIAIADTPGLAWGAARFLVRDSTGPLVIPVHDSHVMPGLPIQALRLSKPVTETLQQLGVLKIGQLMQLPRHDLTARFGNEIHRRLDQMSAILEEPIVARRKPALFYAQQSLDFPTSDRETIETILQQLICQLCTELSGKQQGALEWTVKMYCQNKRLPWQFRVRLFQPAAAVEQIVQLVQMQLEQTWQSRPNQRPPTKRQTGQGKPRHRKRRHVVKLLDGQTLEVNEVSVEVTSCVLLTQQQRQLFDERPRENRRELAQLINRLASRLGYDQVVYPTLRRQAQPEHAFRFQPLIDTGKRPRSTGKPGYLSHVMARPLQLYEPPIPLTPLPLTPNSIMPPGQSLSPGATSSPPVRVKAVGPPGFNSPPTPGFSNHKAMHTKPPAPSTEHQIIRSWGPERIETGWWRGRLARRDYWRIETETHQQFWIYRDLSQGDWFLHGAF